MKINHCHYALEFPCEDHNVITREVFQLPPLSTGPFLSFVRGLEVIFLVVVMVSVRERTPDVVEMTVYHDLLLHSQSRTLIRLKGSPGPM